MPQLSEWQVPSGLQPSPERYEYDLDRALMSVMGLSARIPEDAFTADVLGTERAGSGVLISEDGVVLTVGYLITEAESIWLSLANGRSVPAHAVAYDQTTGFGLVQALGRLDLPVLPLGRSATARVGEKVVVGSAGGRARSVAAQIVSRQQFAGYWEYVLDEAIFTAPVHPYWGGTAVIGPAGDLLGIGSLQVEHGHGGESLHLNMAIPIDLLKPVMDDMLRLGRPNRPPRPWLGLYAAEVDDRMVVLGLAGRGPAERAGVATGDIILAVGGARVGGLADFFREIWRRGDAGVEVPLMIERDGRPLEIVVASADRGDFLKRPKLQ